MRGNQARDLPGTAPLPLHHQPLARYLIAIVITLMALLVKLVFGRYIGGGYPFLLFFTAVMSSAWIGGMGPGLASTALSALFCAILFLPQHPSLTDSIWAVVVPLAVFLLESMVMSTLGGARWRAQRDRMLRVQHERALRHSEARSAAILEAALDSIISMDATGRVIEWNAAAERCFGYTREEAIGRSMAELIIPPSLREAHHRGLERYLASGQAAVIGKRIELIGMRKDGTEFPVELTITRTAEAGPPEFTGYLRDISQRKQSEQERERLLESERHARSEAERASRLKDEFLATVSHELRTPLNAILGYTHLLGTGKLLGEEVPQALNVIERSAKVQAQLVGDILDMSRVVSGKLHLDIQSVDLSKVIDAALETVRPAADAKGIGLVKITEPGVELVNGDPARLQQVIWNLLSNAIKFTPGHGRVEVFLRRADGHVEIAVSDTGEGIAPEFLPFLFDRFRQADASSTRRHGGLGLGLSIVKSLVENHGGTVRAASPGLGKGATFTVSLPVSAVQASQPRHIHFPSQDSSARAHPALTGVAVLVVDDDADTREIVSRLLKDCGATVIPTACAREALSALDLKRVDVVLSDIGMSEMDGYELIRQIRARAPDRGGTLPAAALTAFARSEDRTRALMAGYQTHVAKPVEPIELVYVVASLAGRTGAGSPPPRG